MNGYVDVMEVKVDKDNTDYALNGDYVEILGLLSSESDFGQGIGPPRSFIDRYEGRKVLKLSVKPSSKWIRVYQWRTTKEGCKATYFYSWRTVLLQPLNKKLFFISENKWTDACIDYLHELFKWVNENIDMDLNAVTNPEKKKNSEENGNEIKSYLRYKNII